MFWGTVTFSEALRPGCSWIWACSNRWFYFWSEWAKGRTGCGGPAPTLSWSNYMVCCLTALAHTCAVVKDFSLWSHWSMDMHEHKRCICYKSTDLGRWRLGQAKLGCTRCAFPTRHLINTPLLPPPCCPFSTAESRHKGTLSSWHIPLLINVMQCSHNTTTMPAM